VARISVLIPAHNESAVLRECLDAVSAQTLQVDEIVVVADSCSDDTADVARSYGAVVVETQQGAKAASQDVGLPHVTGDVLICIDADTVIDVDVVEKFMAELEAGADATCANMLPMPQQRGFWVANRRFAYALGRFWWRWCQAQVGRLMVLSGCAYGLRTETVRSIGGFPGELITCDMDLTWSLYEAGYKTTFCHHALAYTYDPETFAVYTKQMRRWASGFFQNFQSHKLQVLKSPSALLVVGTMLFDLLSLPITWVFAILWAVRDPEKLKWMVPAFLISLAVHWVVSMVIVTRTIPWRQALVGFPCYWAANWWNKTIYLWTFIREWILGRHYMSWTGRQGRATEIAPMSPARKLCLLILATATAGWLATENQPLRLPLFACVLVGMISLLLVARSWPDNETAQQPAAPTTEAELSPQHLPGAPTPLTQIDDALEGYRETLRDRARTVRDLESAHASWLTRFEDRLQAYEQRQEHRLQRLHELIATHDLAVAPLTDPGRRSTSPGLANATV
jgi:glycosyltransferase involved in cell wall biosynthesis